jgi:hypothetical protein
MANEFNVSIFRSWLPKTFENVITGFSGTSSDNFIAEIRSSVSSPIECEEWMKIYGRQSRISWNVYKTYPSAAAYFFKKKLLLCTFEQEEE